MATIEHFVGFFDHFSNNFNNTIEKIGFRDRIKAPEPYRTSIFIGVMVKIMSLDICHFYQHKEGFKHDF